MRMTKRELLQKLEDQREKFLDVLETIPEELWEIKGIDNNWSIKDILAHLTRWEAELVKLLWQINQGQRPNSILLDKIIVNEVNANWLKESQNRTLHKVLEDFHSVRNRTIFWVESFNEKALFDPKRYKWLKNKPLSEWIADNSYGHEEEHLQTILHYQQRLE